MYHPWTTHPRNYIGVVGYFLSRKLQTMILYVNEEWHIKILCNDTGALYEYRPENPGNIMAGMSKLEQYVWVSAQSLVISKMLWPYSSGKEALRPTLAWLTKQSVGKARASNKFFVGPGLIRAERLTLVHEGMEKPQVTSYIVT